jgi:hypothetical protein
MSQSRVFISYSHRGKGPECKSALLRALHVFERHHLLDVWQDGRIRVSSYWDDDIKQAISSARLAVVLVTKEALESEYILGEEFPILRERQQRDKLPVFPVVCEECDWKAHDWLRATQAPNESNPLSLLSEAAQDRVFRKLATDIAEDLSRAALAELPKPDLPPLPDHIYLDKFPLTRSTGPREEKLIGREQELALLDLAFAQPHTAIVSLVGWGGVGKTMLVQHWLQRLQREGWFGAQRVYAWSFYSQGTKEDRQASEDTFLAHALEWYGVQCEPTLSPWDKGRLLADAVVRERTLLILDGIEPLQYPPGPMGGQLRAPGVQSLLKQLARKANDTEHRGLCLVTTREPLTDLADFERRPDAAWGSVLRVALGNLTEEAGAALLHHAGVNRAGAAEIKPDDAELLAAGREVDGHALTLNLLGRFLARAHGGDIRRRDLVKFQEADRKVQGGTTFKMLAAFENWFARSGDFGARQLAIVRMLGLFDRPADAGCIGALRKPPVIAGLTEPLFTVRSDPSSAETTIEPLIEEDWNTATSFLADFGLLTIQAVMSVPRQICTQMESMFGILTVPTGLLTPRQYENSLDCHALVRDYFAEQVRNRIPEAWQAAHGRLYHYLKTSVRDESEPTLDDLQPLYQAIAHGCQAGMHEEACDGIYADRILRGGAHYSWHKLGAYGAELAAQASFFDQPWNRLSTLLSERAQAWLSNETAHCLRSLGRLVEAVGLQRAGVEAAVRHEGWRNASIYASNLSELELTLGDTPAALAEARMSVAYADRSGDAFEMQTDRVILADALHQAGDESAALTLFRMAEAIQARREPEYRMLYSVSGFRYCDLLLTHAERAAWKGSVDMLYSGGICQSVRKRAAETMMVKGLGILSIALDRLTLGRAELYSSVLDPSLVKSAAENIEAALDGLRRANAQEFIPRGLVTRAFLRSASRDASGAETDLDEAWDIAERGPMRLHMADIHLYRAGLFFRGKAYPWKSPQDDLAAAEKLINECGYHRRDQELADAKQAILGT